MRERCFRVEVVRGSGTTGCNENVRGPVVIEEVMVSELSDAKRETGNVLTDVRTEYKVDARRDMPWRAQRPMKTDHP